MPERSTGRARGLILVAILVLGGGAWYVFKGRGTPATSDASGLTPAAPQAAASAAPPDPRAMSLRTCFIGHLRRSPCTSRPVPSHLPSPPSRALSPRTCRHVCPVPAPRAMSLRTCPLRHVL
jgi:hypothetical protein